MRGCSTWPRAPPASASSSAPTPPPARSPPTASTPLAGTDSACRGAIMFTTSFDFPLSLGLICDLFRGVGMITTCGSVGSSLRRPPWSRFVILVFFPRVFS